MKKRIISALLSVVMLFATATPVFAFEHERSSSTEIGDTTAFEDISLTTDGQYILAVETDNATEYLQVGRADMSVSNPASIIAVLKNEDIEIEVRNEIQQQFEEAIRTGNTSMRMVLFSQDLLEQSIPENSINSTYATIVYNGANMKSDRVYTYGRNTGWFTITSGSSTKNVIQNIASIGLTAAGTVNKTVNFFSTGISLLTAFFNVGYSNYVTGSTQDHSYARIIYDDVKQWTYRQVVDQWYLGLVSQKVTVTQIGHEEYFYNASLGQGKTNTSDRTVNVEIKSEHFMEPWEQAYTWMNQPRTEYISYNINGKTLQF